MIYFSESTSYATLVSQTLSDWTLGCSVGLAAVSLAQGMRGFAFSVLVAPQD